MLNTDDLLTAIPQAEYAVSACAMVFDHTRTPSAYKGVRYENYDRQNAETKR